MERKKKTYRNAIRSKKAIIRAYVQLLHEQQGRKITVTDIVELADLNRSTFYGHFESVEDVAEHIRIDVFEKLLGSLDKKGIENSLRFPHLAMEHVRDFLKSDEELYKDLLNTEGVDKFLRRLREAIVSQYMADVNTVQTIRDKESFEMQLRLFVGGYIEVIKDWAAGDIKMSLEKCTDLISQSIEHSIEAYGV